MSAIYQCQDCGLTAEIDKMHKRSHGGWDCRSCFGELEECQYHLLLLELAKKSLNNVEREELINGLKAMIEEDQNKCNHKYEEDHTLASCTDETYTCVKCYSRTKS
jgi:hypothetical protein